MENGLRLRQLRQMTNGNPEKMKVGVWFEWVWTIFSFLYSFYAKTALLIVIIGGFLRWLCNELVTLAIL